MNMKKQKNLINEEDITTQANLNNLEPGNSVDEHRRIETANLILTSEEIKQQNNNL